MAAAEGDYTMFVCCNRCQGVYQSENDLQQHQTQCDGDPVKANCEAYVCDRETYLASYACSFNDLIKLFQRKNPGYKVILKNKDSHNTSQQTKPDEHAYSVPNVTAEEDNVKGCETNVKQRTTPKSMKRKCSSDKSSPQLENNVDVKVDPVELCTENKLNDLPVKRSRRANTQRDYRSVAGLKSILRTSENQSQSKVKMQEAPEDPIKMQEAPEGPIKMQEASEGPIGKRSNESETAQEGETIKCNTDSEAGDADDSAPTGSELIEEENGGDQNDHGETPLMKKDKVGKNITIDKNKHILLLEKYSDCYKEGKDGVQAYHCKLCTKVSKHIGFFHRHNETCHNAGEQWKCEQCEFVCLTKSQLKLHNNKHIKPYLCEFCSHSFAQYKDMKIHVMRHTGELPYSCDKCDYKCRQSRALKEHMRKHDGNLLHCSAEDCEFTSCFKWAVDNHYRCKHVATKRFSCSKCSYQTSDSGSLLKHYKLHMGRKDFKCSQCSYKAITKHDVVKHMRCHTKEKVYFCDRCDYSTSYSSALRTHMMSHLGIKPWQCSLCGYNALSKDKVMRHLKKRHKGAPNGGVINLGVKMVMKVGDFKLPEIEKPKMIYNVIQMPSVNVSEEEVPPAEDNETQDVIQEAVESEIITPEMIESGQIQVTSEMIESGQVQVIPEMGDVAEDGTVTQIILSESDLENLGQQVHIEHVLEGSELPEEYSMVATAEEWAALTNQDVGYSTVIIEQSSE